MEQRESNACGLFLPSITVIFSPAELWPVIPGQPRSIFDTNGDHKS